MVLGVNANGVFDLGRLLTQVEKYLLVSDIKGLITTPTAFNGVAAPGVVADSRHTLGACAILQGPEQALGIEEHRMNRCMVQIRDHGLGQAI